MTLGDLKSINAKNSTQMSQLGIPSVNTIFFK